MWPEDLIKACNALIKKTGKFSGTYPKVIAAFDGIVFRTCNGDSYKYWYETQEITIIKKDDWRKKIS